jgi:hypothetical protein
MLREYPYNVVPDSYRARVYRWKRKNHQKITNPIIKDLLAGKTLLVDAQIPIHTKGGFPREFRSLYNTFSSRGYRLHCYMYDDVDRDIYRALIMWAEPLVKLWNCSRCGNFEVSNEEGKPSNKHCDSKYRAHSWRSVKEMHKHHFIESAVA